MKEIAPRIAVDPNVRFGKPVILGTRIAVGTILGHLAAGNTPEELAAEYDISREDVLACVAYAALLVEEEQVRTLP